MPGAPSLLLLALFPCQGQLESCLTCRYNPPQREQIPSCHSEQHAGANYAGEDYLSVGDRVLWETSLSQVPAGNRSWPLLVCLPNGQWPEAKILCWPASSSRCRCP